jgi:4-alpha-glucanotransferase
MPERAPGRFSTGRHAGILVPLFSIPSRTSWGIGEIPDLVSLARWLQSAGLDFVQLLPVNEMPEGERSPYSAMSAMAIDPVYIAVDRVEEWGAAGSPEAHSFSPNVQADASSPIAEHASASASSTRVDYGAVRARKNRALACAFDWFEQHAAGQGGERDRALDEFAQRERWWLDDYVLFRALHDEHGGRPWRRWDAGVRDRNPAALESARRRLDRQIRYHTFVQWIADEQWRAARRDAAPVGLFGDFPFTVSSNSADVWARQHEFDLDASVGTPPDAFSETGQDWGLPAYRWDVVAASGYAWLRDRTRRAASLYDGFRVDHVIGFYRSYVRMPDGAAGFQPSGESAQRAQGERLLTVFGGEDATIIAEDLGTVPDFLRESLAELGIPGMKVLRWEREWQAPGKPFRDPPEYPAESVATTGTHDTETLADWWDGADIEERQSLLQVPALRHRGLHADAPYTDRTRDALLEALFAAGSRLLILPVQDIFGWRDRINTPASVGEQNWTWRLPLEVERLLDDPASVERAASLRALSRKTGRGS